MVAGVFVDIRIDVKEDSRAIIAEWQPGSGAETFAASASIEAVKPSWRRRCGPLC